MQIRNVNVEVLAPPQPSSRRLAGGPWWGGTGGQDLGWQTALCSNRDTPRLLFRFLGFLKKHVLQRQTPPHSLDVPAPRFPRWEDTQTQKVYRVLAEVAGGVNGRAEFGSHSPNSAGLFVLCCMILPCCWPFPRGFRLLMRR